MQDPVDQQYSQTGEKRVRGVELSAVGQHQRAWSVSAGFTTMDTQVENGPIVARTAADDLTYTPDKRVHAVDDLSLRRSA